jgi:hypothetical protein
MDCRSFDAKNNRLNREDGSRESRILERFMHIYVCMTVHLHIIYNIYFAACSKLSLPTSLPSRPDSRNPTFLFSLAALPLHTSDWSVHIVAHCGIMDTLLYDLPPPTSQYACCASSLYLYDGVKLMLRKDY